MDAAAASPLADQPLNAAGSSSEAGGDEGGRAVSSTGTAALRRELVRARAALSAAASWQIEAERRAAELEETAHGLRERAEAAEARERAATTAARRGQAALDDLRWRVTVEGRISALAITDAPGGSVARMRGPVGGAPPSPGSAATAGAHRSSASNAAARLDALRHPTAATAAALKAAILGGSGRKPRASGRS